MKKLAKDNDKNDKKKKPKTIYLTETINNAITTIIDNSNLGLTRNQVITSCIVAGLKTLYGIEIK